MKRLQIKTAQNININFTLASAGQRLTAFIIDNLLKFIYLYVLFFVFNIWDSVHFETDHWSIKTFYIIIMLPITFYSLYSEILMRGQTIGKILLKIKIINIDGFKPSITDFMMRWFLRTIDFNFFSLIFIYIYSLGIERATYATALVSAFFLGKMVGFLLIIFTDNNQRFGDLIANTIVISLKDKVQFSETILEDLKEDYVPTYPNVINFSDNDMRIIKDTFNSIDKKKDIKTLRKLRTKIEGVANIESKEKSDVEFIQKVLKDFNFYTQNG